MISIIHYNYEASTIILTVQMRKLMLKKVIHPRSRSQYYALRLEHKSVSGAPAYYQQTMMHPFRRGKEVKRDWIGSSLGFKGESQKKGSPKVHTLSCLGYLVGVNSSGNKEYATA